MTHIFCCFRCCLKCGRWVCVAAATSGAWTARPVSPSAPRDASTDRFDRPPAIVVLKGRHFLFSVHHLTYPYDQGLMYSAWHHHLQPGMNVLYDSSVQQLIVTWIYGISSVHSTWHQHLRPGINVRFLFSVQRLTSVPATRVSVAVIAQDVSFILHSTRNSYGWKDNTIGTDFSEVVSKKLTYYIR